MMGDTLVRFLCSIATAYIVAIAIWPLLTGGGRRNLVGSVLAIVGISLCPALIPPEKIIARAFACLLCIDPLFRVLDYGRQIRKRTVNPVRWREYWTFLIPFPFLLTVFGEKERAKQPIHFEQSDVPRIMVCLVGAALALSLCVQSHQVAALRESFVLDHLIKIILFTVFVESASQLMVVVERLSGFATTPVIDRAYLARTPAELWFRWNQRVRQWLHANVFLPSGGRRSPLVGVSVVFLVSAIFHEFFFGLATSRWDGYQFTFFMLQVPAVILSPRLQRLAAQGIAGRLTARGLTWLWFAVTSPLFFHGLDRVFPFFYATRPWLP